MKTAGIIGHPVGHSLSPVFQSAAFAACGLEVTYAAWDTPLAELPARVQSLRGHSALGANVTVPYKEAVLPLLDELDAQAARIGAVNTIVNRDGDLTGFNTDGPGFVRALRDEAAFDCAGKSFLLLGAGGAARGIAFALAGAHAARIGILNRSPDRAVRLAHDVSGTGADVSVETTAGSLAQYDCVVNCTSVGMRGGPDPTGMPIDLEALRPGALVVDIVYAPEETPLLAAAKVRGLPTFGGLPMLIYQGALAFELWTGVRAPVDVMFEAARNELAARAAAS